MTIAPTLSYAPLRPPSRFLNCYLLFLGCTLLPAFIFGILLLFFIPRFSTIFAQFRAPLPFLTQWVLNIAHLAQHLILFPLWIILLGTVPLVPAALCARHDNPRRRTTTLILFLFLYLLAFLLIPTLIVIAMLLPLFNLQQLIH